MWFMSDIIEKVAKGTVIVIAAIFIIVVAVQVFFLLLGGYNWLFR